MRTTRTDRSEKIYEGFTVGPVPANARKWRSRDDMLVRSRTGIAKNMSHDVAVTAA